MYKIFSILFISTCIILISLIIFNQNKNNINIINTDNYLNKGNTVITSNLVKNTLNYIIIIFSILFYILAIILNLINNIKINKFKNKINNVKIYK